MLLDIGLLIYAIVIMARGEMYLCGPNVARGVSAYLAAVVFMLPLPLVLMMDVFVRVSNHPNVPLISLWMVMDLGIFLGCLFMGMIIAYVSSEIASTRRRNRSDDDCRRWGRYENEEEEDYGRGRTRSDDRFSIDRRDDDRDRPRRYDDEDDDDSPRPRRRSR